MSMSTDQVHSPSCLCSRVWPLGPRGDDVHAPHRPLALQLETKDVQVPS